MGDNEKILEWFVFADRDLAAAEFLLGMRPQPLEIICYQCQQSAEKYLKGYLKCQGMSDPPKIHDLPTLLLLCMPYDSSFDSIKWPCAVLTQYGTQPRYPDEVYIDEALMHRALDCARQIKNFAPMQHARAQLEQSSKE